MGGMEGRLHKYLLARVVPWGGMRAAAHWEARGDLLLLWLKTTGKAGRRGSEDLGAGAVWQSVLGGLVIESGREQSPPEL